MKNNTILQRIIPITVLLSFIGSCERLNAAPTGPYGAQEFRLGHDEIETIKHLYALIEKSSPEEHPEVAQQILADLEHEQLLITQEEARLQAAHDATPREFYHKQFINKHRIAHFKKLLAKDDSWKQYVLDHLQSVKRTVIGFFAYLLGNQNPSATQELAAEVSNYFRIEDDEILYNKQGVGHLIALLRYNKIPQFIAIWKDPAAQEELRLRVDRLDIARVQMAGMIEMATNAAVLGVAFAAGSQALSVAEQEFATKRDALYQAQKKISEDLNNASAKLQQDKENAFKDLETSFQTSSSQVVNEENRTIALFGQEIQYLNKSVIGFENPLEFLSNLSAAKEMDINFEASVLLTPTSNNGPVWYNPFQNGDWQFDAPTKSFWQNQLNPMPTPFIWDDPERLLGYDPARYSIFTEYINPQPKTGYSIQVKLQLISCDWPFFAGIMFNKARWISGNPEAESQYRLLGIYGSQTDPQDVATRKLELCFAQQKIKIVADAQGKNVITITTPLEQIVKRTGTVLYQFDSYDTTKNDAQQVARNPQTYNITITTHPTTVDYVFEKIDAQQKTNSVTNSRIENLAAMIEGPVSPTPYSLFKYHGIGLLATGCQGQFTIQQPAALTYTDDQIIKFNAAQTAYLEKLKKEVKP